MEEYWIEKLITYKNVNYKLYINTSHILFMNSPQKTILSLFITIYIQSSGNKLKVWALKDNLSNEKMNHNFHSELKYNSQYFPNDAFQSYYHLFQVNWLVQIQRHLDMSS